MIQKSELLRVPAFADLPDDQIAWFLGQSQEIHLKAGDTYVRQGDPAESRFEMSPRCAKPISTLSTTHATESAPPTGLARCELRWRPSRASAPTTPSSGG